MSLSVIIPFYPGRNGEHQPMLSECIASLQGGYDELLVMRNRPHPDGRAPFAEFVNRGLAQATGDYRLVLNSDTKLLSGNLRDLCVPGVITTPTINGEAVPFHGCAFCIPRTVYEVFGGLDERFVGNWEDADFCQRAYRAGIPLTGVPSVSLWHQGGATYRELNQDAMQHGENERLFVERWGTANTLGKLMEQDRANGCFVEPVAVL